MCVMNCSIVRVCDKCEYRVPAAVDLHLHIYMYGGVSVMVRLNLSIIPFVLGRYALEGVCTVRQILKKSRRTHERKARPQSLDSCRGAPRRKLTRKRRKLAISVVFGARLTFQRTAYQRQPTLSPLSVGVSNTSAHDSIL